MQKKRFQPSQLMKILLGYLAIGGCGYALSYFLRVDLRIELSFAIALALISKGRTNVVCMLGSLILSLMLGVMNDLDTLTNAVMSLWSAVGTLVLCTVSTYAIRRFLNTRWRTLLELNDFIKLLVIGGLLSSLIPATFDTTAHAFFYGTSNFDSLILVIIFKWLGIALGSCVFLPLILSLLLRNTAVWNTRAKTMAFWLLLMVGGGLYLSATETAINIVITRHHLAQEAVAPVRNIASKIAEIEGAIIGFNQIVKISKTFSSNYLPQLSQRIFSQYPSIRSLSIPIDAEPIRQLRGTRTADSALLDYFVPDESGHQLLQFYNPRYPKTQIDSTVISHYLDRKNNERPKRIIQNLQIFSLVKHHPDRLIIVYDPSSLEETQDPEPTGFERRNNLTYVDIDIEQLLSSDMKMEDINLHMPWRNIQLQINVSSDKTPLSFVSAFDLIHKNHKIELATIKLFNQDLSIHGNLSPDWIQRYTWQTLVPHKILQLLIVVLYIISVFVIVTRQMRFRIMFTKQGAALECQNQRLTLFQKSIENSQEAIAILKNQNGSLYIAYVNESFCKMAGKPASEFIDIVWTAHIDFQINDQALSVLKQSIAEGLASRAELTLINEHSEWRWVDLTLTPIGADESTTMYWLLSQQDISERKRIDLELKRSELEARNLSATKSRFLENMSHEIRTPLSGIIGLTNLAQNTQDPQIIQQHLSTIKKSANHQLEIITSILNALKIEASQIHTIERNINLSILLDETLDILLPNAQLKNIALNVKISNNIPTYVQSDSLLLKQILLNLLANAIKFTNKGHVDITLDYLFSNEQGIGIRFSIEDSGIGLGSLSLNKITQPFFKGELNSNTDGIGLGLAIVESYLKQMNSRLQVHNQNNFGGSTFYFDLLCKYPSKDQEEPIQNSLQTPSLTQSIANKAFAGLHFLIVEDNLINQIVLMGYLNNSGATIDIASNGETALSKITSTEYDLILLDLRIPKFDTSSIAKLLDRIHNDSNVSIRPPIIGISASQHDDYDATLSRYGLSDFLTKPIDQALLFEIIKKYVFSNTTEIKTTLALSSPSASSGNSDLPPIELQQLFLEQALVIRPKFDHYFNQHESKDLSDALHFIQGSASALSLLDLQQAAQDLEDSLRNETSQPEKYLNFIELYDKKIIFFKQSLSTVVPQVRQELSLKTALQTNQPTRRFNILLIDDNLLVSKVLGSQITEKGLSVDFAYSSEDALLKLDTHHYDVIITDLILPDIDGYTFTKIISAQHRFKDMIIFGLSASVSDAIEQACKAEGMKRLFSKLSHPSELIATLVETIQTLNREKR